MILSRELSSLTMLFYNVTCKFFSYFSNFSYFVEDCYYSVIFSFCTIIFTSKLLAVKQCIFLTPSSQLLAVLFHQFFDITVIHLPILKNVARQGIILNHNFARHTNNLRNAHQARFYCIFQFLFYITIKLYSRRIYNKIMIFFLIIYNCDYLIVCDVHFNKKICSSLFFIL